MRTLLFDGDMVAWVSAYAGGKVACRAVATVERQAGHLVADRVIVCLSDQTRLYWKHALWPEYKPNRSARPAEYGAAVSALRAAFITREIPALEADDVIGILATHPQVEGETIIVAADKDLLTVPGSHFNPKHPSRGVFDVSVDDADRRHLLSALTGDATDGYPGCPGIGEKRAEAILWGDRRQWWTLVVLAFKSKGLREADALLQARLARILRAADYDVTTRHISQWTPAAITRSPSSIDNLKPEAVR